LDAQIATQGLTDEIKNQMDVVVQQQVSLERAVNALEKHPQLARIIEILEENPRLKAAVICEEVEPTQNEEDIVEAIEHLPKPEKEAIKDYAEMSIDTKKLNLDAAEEAKLFVEMPEQLYRQIMSNPNSIPEILDDPTKKNYLKSYLIENVAFNRHHKPWSEFDKHDPKFLTEVKKIKDSQKPNTRSKKGSGVKFLSSDKKEIQHELKRLIGSYEARNENTFNEINAIVDTLRRNNHMSLNESKYIYK
jgi:hypothetical protein